MRDYADQIARLRECANNSHEVHSKCGAYLSGVCAKTRDIRMQDAADAIEELLAELTTIRKQFPRWISVEDELPEEEKPVFVTYIGYNTGSLHSDMIAYQDGEGDWRYYDGDNGSDICKVDITHWMPLPTPPKGVE